MNHIHNQDFCRMDLNSGLPLVARVQECRPNWFTVQNHILLPCDIELVDLNKPLKPIINQ